MFGKNGLKIVSWEESIWFEGMSEGVSASLETFSVDDGRSRLVVFLFRDPHLLERRQGS